MGQTVTLTASDDFKLGGYRADPASAPKGAIVVIQEIFGVNSHIRNICDRFAKEGYVALAPAIFDRMQPDFQSGYTPEEVAVARKFIASPDWPAMLRDTATLVPRNSGVCCIRTRSCSSRSTPSSTLLNTTRVNV